MFDKLIKSSTDPKTLSLTVRGILMSIVPVVMIFTGMSEDEVTSVVDVIQNIVFLATSLIAALQVAYGLIRKVKLGRWSAPE